MNRPRLRYFLLSLFLLGVIFIVIHQYNSFRHIDELIDMDVDDKTPHILSGDSVRLMQILVNLIGLQESIIQLKSTRGQGVVFSIELEYKIPDNNEVSNSKKPIESTLTINNKIKC